MVSASLADSMVGYAISMSEDNDGGGGAIAMVTEGGQEMAELSNDLIVRGDVSVEGTIKALNAQGAALVTVDATQAVFNTTYGIKTNQSINLNKVNTTSSGYSDATIYANGGIAGQNNKGNMDLSAGTIAFNAATTYVKGDFTVQGDTRLSTFEGDVIMKGDLSVTNPVNGYKMLYCDPSTSWINSDDGLRVNNKIELYGDNSVAFGFGDATIEVTGGTTNLSNQGLMDITAKKINLYGTDGVYAAYGIETGQKIKMGSQTSGAWTANRASMYWDDSFQRLVITTPNGVNKYLTPLP